MTPSESCRYCEAPIAASEERCGSCGAPLDPDQLAARAADADARAADAARGKRSKLLLVLVVLGLLLAGGGYATWYFGFKPIVVVVTPSSDPYCEQIEFVERSRETHGDRTYVTVVITNRGKSVVSRVDYGLRVLDEGELVRGNSRPVTSGSFALLPGESVGQQLDVPSFEASDGKLEHCVTRIEVGPPAQAPTWTAFQVQSGLPDGSADPNTLVRHEQRLWRLDDKQGYDKDAYLLVARVTPVDQRRITDLNYTLRARAEDGSELGQTGRDVVSSNPTWPLPAIEPGESRVFALHVYVPKGSPTPSFELKVTKLGVR